MLTPSSTALSAASHRATRARSRETPSSVAEASKSIGSTRTGKSARAPLVSLARSSLVRMGCSSSSRRHCAGVSASRLPSPPRQLARVITSFSRMGSMGGLVTCANCCLKYRKRSCGRSLSTASGASLPMLPVGSSPLVAIGVSRIFRSSREYPAARRRRLRSVAPIGAAATGAGSDASPSLFPSSHSAYGLRDATSRLISSSPTRRPFARSTRSILPGCRRPFSRISSGSKSRTPSSLAATTKPLAVTTYFIGRRPLRSSVAPT